MRKTNSVLLLILDRNWIRFKKAYPFLQLNCQLEHDLLRELRSVKGKVSSRRVPIFMKGPATSKTRECWSVSLHESIDRFRKNIHLPIKFLRNNLGVIFLFYRDDTSLHITLITMYTIDSVSPWWKPSYTIN